MVAKAKMVSIHENDERTETYTVSYVHQYSIRFSLPKGLQRSNILRPIALVRRTRVIQRRVDIGQQKYAVDSCGDRTFMSFTCPMESGRGGMVKENTPCHGFWAGPNHWIRRSFAEEDLCGYQ